LFEHKFAKMWSSVKWHCRRIIVDESSSRSNSNILCDIQVIQAISDGLRFAAVFITDCTGVTPKGVTLQDCFVSGSAVITWSLQPRRRDVRWNWEGERERERERERETSLRSEKIDGLNCQLISRNRSAGRGALFDSIDGMIDVTPIVTSAVVAARQSSGLDAPLRSTRPTRYREVIDKCDRAKAAVTWPVMM